jgi:phage/conjugal plasmid C-4 type zinc finger TraR family protein
MDEKYLEQAARLEQYQRDANVRSVQQKLTGAGQADCLTCGDAIPCDRRQAVPSANRCLSCQSKFEFRKGLGL